jgi:Zn-dependent protease/predicted transcriptional regulator
MRTRKAIHIGRLFGIELKLDPSWLFIFVLVVWSLTSVFQAWHPIWATRTSLAVALVAGFAFFGSILLHELAHALVAKLYGVPVRDITLHMFGGVSNIEREPPTAGAELLIAIVGPIASIALGVSMLGLAALVTGAAFDPSAPGADAAAMMAGLSPISTLLVWLGPVNIVVGLFNLVPGFPLDGGRILRAVLWRSTGNLRKATRWSTSVGRAVGVAFIAIGGAMVLGLRVPFFGTGFGAGLWLALIGMFLRGAATQHQAGSDVADALEGVHVRDLMRTTGATVPANASLRALVDRWFVRRDEGVLAVFHFDEFAGIVSMDDLARVPREQWDDRAAREIMIPAKEVAKLSPEDAAFEALRTMGAAGVGGLHVLDEEGTLIGMLYERDVARWVALQTPVMRSDGGDRARHA